MLSIKEKRLYLYVTLFILLYSLIGLLSPPFVRISVAASEVKIERFNLNTADVEHLQIIKGIGPKTAAKIIQHRNELDGFKDWLEVLSVKGIGPKKLEILKIHTYLEDEAKPKTQNEKTSDQ